VVGQAIVALVFLLPAISFLVVPLTTWLIRKDRLTFSRIGLLAVVGWLTLSILGWIVSSTITPPYSLLSLLEGTIIPVLL
jgi:hypothetical protein